MNQRSNVRVDDGVRRRPETKSFILTSEFWVAGAAAAAVFIAGYALDDIAETTAWRYGTWIAIAYIVSRGLTLWKGKVIIATLDGRLIALDARNGQPVWSVQTFDKSWSFFKSAP